MAHKELKSKLNTMQENIKYKANMPKSEKKNSAVAS